MEINNKKFIQIYYVALVLNSILICLKGSKIGTLCIFAYLTIIYLLKYISNEEYLILTLFIPNKYLQLLALYLYLFFKKDFFRYKFNKQEATFLVYITILGIANCLIYDGLLFQTLFQIVFYIGFCGLLYSFSKEFNYENYMHIFDDLAIVQIITSLIQLLIYRQTADFITGTLISAHYLGVYLLIYIYWKFKYKNKNTHDYIKLALLIVILWLADAKHVWGLFLVALLFSILFDKKKSRYNVTIFALLLFVGVYSVILTANTMFMKEIINKVPTIATYFYSPSYNKKYEFFYNAFSKANPINMIFGYGVGQYESQISLTFSKGYIYSWDPTLIKYRYAIQPYRNAISGIMTEWYVKEGIGISSMVLGYPLVSFIPLIMELGLIGYCMFSNVLDKYFIGYKKVFIYLFLMLTIFDTYIEIPCVFVLVLISTYMNKAKKE